MFYLIAVTLSSWFFWVCIVFIIAGSFGLRFLSDYYRKMESLQKGENRYSRHNWYSGLNYTWLEFGVQIVACFIIAMIVNAWALSSLTGMTDTKIEVGYKDKAHYRASYTELVEKRKSYHSRGRTRHTYYKVREYKAAKWWVTDSFGREKDIGTYAYEELVNSFGNSRLYKSKQNNQVDGDGREWISEYMKGQSTILPVIKPSLYVNMLKGSKIVSKYAKEYAYLSPAKEYPRFDNFEMSKRVIADIALDIKYIYSASDIFAKICAEYSDTKKFNLIMYVTNQPKEFKYRLLSDWKMGKRNDIVILIGSKDGRNIEWTDVIAWTEKKNFSEVLNRSLLQLKLTDLQGLESVLKDTMKLYQPMSDREYELLSKNIDIPAKFYFIAGSINLVIFLILAGIFLFKIDLKLEKYNV